MGTDQLGSLFERLPTVDDLSFVHALDYGLWLSATSVDHADRLPTHHTLDVSFILHDRKLREITDPHKRCRPHQRIVALDRDQIDVRRRENANPDRRIYGFRQSRHLRTIVKDQGNRIVYPLVLEVWLGAQSATFQCFSYLGDGPFSAPHVAERREQISHRRLFAPGGSAGADLAA